MNDGASHDVVHIIGAGMSGLGCAHFLKKAGIASVLYEENDQIGGKAGFIRRGEERLEVGGKNFRSNWPLFNQILQDLDLKKFTPQHQNPVLLLDGKPVSLTRGITMPDSWLLFKALGFGNAARLRRTLKYVRRNRRALGPSSPLMREIEERYDSRPITDRFDRRLTHTLYRMFTIIMGGAEPEETYYSNLVALLAEVASGGAHFALRGGIGTFFQAIARPHEVRLNARVEKIIIRENRVEGLVVSGNGGPRTVPADHVVSAAPLHVLKNLMEFPPDVVKEIDKIRYYPVTLINAVYEKDVFDPRMTSLMFDDGFHLGHCSANRIHRRNSVRFTLAGKKGRAVMDRPDEELVELAEKEFSSVIPITSPRVFYHVRRHPGGMCAYCGNFSSVKKRIMDHISGVRGLEIAGDYLEGHNMESCLESAWLAADRVVRRVAPGGRLADASIRPAHLHAPGQYDGGPGAARATGGGKRRIEDRVIVVTGASSGLGEKTAMRLGRLGARVALVARSEEGLSRVGAEIGRVAGREPLTVACDVARESDVADMVAAVKERYGRVDVLINNAGFGRYRNSEWISTREMRAHFEVNFFGAYYCIQAVLPLMKARGEGYILNVASLFSLISFQDVSVYAATKFALAGYTRGLRQEMKPYDIDVGLLMPSSIDTPFQEKKGGGRKAPSFMMLDPDRVAKEIETMIRTSKKDLILPKWVGPVVRLKNALG